MTAVPVEELAITTCCRRGSFISRPIEDTARALSCYLSVSQSEFPVDNHVFKTNRILVRFVESRAVGNSGGIEHDDVGLHAWPQKSAICEIEPLGGHSRHAMNRVLES